MARQASECLMRQISGKEAMAWKWSSSESNSTSKWGDNNTANSSSSSSSNSFCHYGEDDDDDDYDGGGKTTGKRKRVMVVVDDNNSNRTHHALMWTLQHATDDADLLTLLQILPSSPKRPLHLASLRSMCVACKPQVEVEAVVIEGHKLETVLSQVKKLEVSLLVLPQGRPRSLPFFLSCFCGGGSKEEKDGFVEECIEYAECLAVGVGKQRKGMGGYLLSTRAHKNFWQLA